MPDAGFLDSNSGTIPEPDTKLRHQAIMCWKNNYTIVRACKTSTKPEGFGAVDYAYKSYIITRVWMKKDTLH